MKREYQFRVDWKEDNLLIETSFYPPELFGRFADLLNRYQSLFLESTTVGGGLMNRIVQERFDSIKDIDTFSCIPLGKPFRSIERTKALLDLFLFALTETLGIGVLENGMKTYFLHGKPFLTLLPDKNLFQMRNKMGQRVLRDLAFDQNSFFVKIPVYDGNTPITFDLRFDFEPHAVCINSANSFQSRIDQWLQNEDVPLHWTCVSGYEPRRSAWLLSQNASEINEEKAKELKRGLAPNIFTIAKGGILPIQFKADKILFDLWCSENKEIGLSGYFDYLTKFIPNHSDDVSTTSAFLMTLRSFFETQVAEKEPFLGTFDRLSQMVLSTLHPAPFYNFPFLRALIFWNYFDSIRVRYIDGPNARHYFFPFNRGYGLVLPPWKETAAILASDPEALHQCMQKSEPVLANLNLPGSASNIPSFLRWIVRSMPEDPRLPLAPLFQWLTQKSAPREEFLAPFLKAYPYLDRELLKSIQQILAQRDDLKEIAPLIPPLIENRSLISFLYGLFKLSFPVDSKRVKKEFEAAAQKGTELQCLIQIAASFPEYLEPKTKAHIEEQIWQSPDAVARAAASGLLFGRILSSEQTETLLSIMPRVLKETNRDQWISFWFNQEKEGGVAFLHSLPPGLIEDPAKWMSLIAQGDEEVRPFLVLDRMEMLHLAQIPVAPLFQLFPKEWLDKPGVATCYWNQFQATHQRENLGLNPAEILARIDPNQLLLSDLEDCLSNVPMSQPLFERYFEAAFKKGGSRLTPPLLRLKNRWTPKLLDLIDPAELSTPDLEQCLKDVEMPPPLFERCLKKALEKSVDPRKLTTPALVFCLTECKMADPLFMNYARVALTREDLSLPVFLLLFKKSKDRLISESVDFLKRQKEVAPSFFQNLIEMLPSSHFCKLSNLNRLKSLFPLPLLWKKMAESSISPNELLLFSAECFREPAAAAEIVPLFESYISKQIEGYDWEALEKLTTFPQIQQERVQNAMIGLLKKKGSHIYLGPKYRIPPNVAPHGVLAAVFHNKGDAAIDFMCRNQGEIPKWEIPIAARIFSNLIELKLSAPSQKALKKLIEDLPESFFLYLVSISKSPRLLHAREKTVRALSLESLASQLSSMKDRSNDPFQRLVKVFVQKLETHQQPFEVVKFLLRPAIKELLQKFKTKSILERNLEQLKKENLPSVWTFVKELLRDLPNEMDEEKAIIVKYVLFRIKAEEVRPELSLKIFSELLPFRSRLDWEDALVFSRFLKTAPQSIYENEAPLLIWDRLVKNVLQWNLPMMEMLELFLGELAFQACRFTDFDQFPDPNSIHSLVAMLELNKKGSGVNFLITYLHSLNMQRSITPEGILKRDQYVNKLWNGVSDAPWDLSSMDKLCEIYKQGIGYLSYKTIIVTTISIYSVIHKLFSDLLKKQHKTELDQERVSNLVEKMQSSFRLTMYMIMHRPEFNQSFGDSQSIRGDQSESIKAHRIAVLCINVHLKMLSLATTICKDKAPHHWSMGEEMLNLLLELPKQENHGELLQLFQICTYISDRKEDLMDLLDFIHHYIEHFKEDPVYPAIQADFIGWLFTQRLSGPHPHGTYNALHAHCAAQGYIITQKQ